MVRVTVPRFEQRIKRLDERRAKNPFTGSTVFIPGRTESVLFFEIELHGNVIEFASGGPNEPTRSRKTEHTSEDEAYAAYAKAIVAKRKRGFVEVGKSRELGEGVPEAAASSVLLEVYFSASDPRFIDELRREKGPKKLAGLAGRWFKDRRPFARQMLVSYIDDGCARAEHHALVKRLFKMAEAAKDHELMARFMVAFDRWNRRSLQTVGYHWDPVKRTSERELGLREDPLVAESIPKGKQSLEFSRSTRRYLSRRVFRYFRRLGYNDPSAYRQVLGKALQTYREEHLNTVGKLLGAWSLLHILYGRSRVLDRRPKGVCLAKDSTLSDLKPAPLFPEIWASAFDELITLVTAAGSLTVRNWASSLLREVHQESLSNLPLLRIRTLLTTGNTEAQTLGVLLFKERENLEEFSLEDWSELLKIESVEVLAVVCERAVTSLSAERLSLGDCVQWVLSPAAPLAELAFGFCRTKPIESDEALQTLLRCCLARVETVRREATSYCVDLLTRLPFGTVEQVRDLCDSTYRDVRTQGLKTALTRFGDDVNLWIALGESPYQDVRHHVIEQAAVFRNYHPDTLNHVCGTVILSLHGAAKDKRRVALELVTRIDSEPDRAPILLPLLRTLLRSTHPTERNVALGALARAATSKEAIRALVLDLVPGIAFTGTVSQ
jgi:hypothetical protein